MLSVRWHRADTALHQMRVTILPRRVRGASQRVRFGGALVLGDEAGVGVRSQRAGRVHKNLTRLRRCEPFAKFGRGDVLGVHRLHRRDFPSFSTTRAAAFPSDCHVSARVALRASTQSVSSLKLQPTEREPVKENGFGASPRPCSSYQLLVGMPVICRRSGSRTMRSGGLWSLIGSRFTVKPPSVLDGFYCRALPCLVADGPRQRWRLRAEVIWVRQIRFLP
jgi:hypothetical protein